MEKKRKLFFPHRRSCASPLQRDPSNRAMAASRSLPAVAFSLCFGLCSCLFAVPLKIFPGSYNVSAGVNVSALRRVALTPEGNSLSLASDPTGTVNFLDMVNNLQGDSGRGYYIEILIGTPGQRVRTSLFVCLLAPSVS